MAIPSAEDAQTKSGIHETFGVVVLEFAFPAACTSRRAEGVAVPIQTLPDLTLIVFTLLEYTSSIPSPTQSRPVSESPTANLIVGAAVQMPRLPVPVKYEFVVPTVSVFE